MVDLVVNLFSPKKVKKKDVTATTNAGFGNFKILYLKSINIVTFITFAILLKQNLSLKKY